MIDLAYIETNSYLLEILMNKYKLLDHFNALRRYLLLGQGDFIRHLMDLMEYVLIFIILFKKYLFVKFFNREELNKDAPNLLYHNLKSLLGKAITETNAQYEPNDIISRLDVRILIVNIELFYTIIFEKFNLKILKLFNKKRLFKVLLPASKLSIFK